MEYVGFWWRAAAAMMDIGMLMFLVYMPLLYGLGYFGDESTVQTVGWIENLIGWVLSAIIVVTFWVTKQATPGKMAISAKIVDADTGGHPGVRRLIVRFLAYSVFMTTLLGLPMLWVAFDKKKQGWHDKLAGTVVIREAREPVKFGKA